MPDVDIDFYDRDNTLKLFKHTPASIIKEGKFEKHKTGVYFHAVPEHPVLKYSLHMMPMKIFQEKNGTGTSLYWIKTEALPSQPI